MFLSLRGPKATSPEAPQTFFFFGIYTYLYSISPIEGQPS
jgi:hypothetical protein